MGSSALARLVATTAAQLRDIDVGASVIVGCSGGADSLALTAACGALTRSGRLRASAIVVDHQLQPGSDRVAATAVDQCRELGVASVASVTVDVDLTAGVGLEAAARAARRAALTRAANEHNAAAILLAHTMDDQAETVLIRLSRGAGTRTLAAMAAMDGLWRRPLLGTRRAECQLVCEELGIQPYQDPHNADSRFTRVRVRHDVLPVLVAALGPAVVSNLARTATLCRQDNDALDQWAGREVDKRVRVGSDGVWILADSDSDSDSDGDLGEVPVAVRARVIRAALSLAGCPLGSLTAAHVTEIDRLVSFAHRGPTRVPGDLEVVRESDKLRIYRAGPLTDGSTH